MTLRQPEAAITTITGVVDSFGAGGGKASGFVELWTLRFALDMWRSESGELCRSPLKIERQVTDAELRDYMQRIRPRTMVCARVTHQGTGAALLDALLSDVVVDAEFDARIHELNSPVYRDHPELGRLTLEPRFRRWFTGQAAWCGSQIGITVGAVDADGFDSAARVVVEVLASQVSWTERLNRALLDALLPLKNGSWRGDDPHLEAEGFLRRATLCSVAADSDGTLRFGFDADDMFTDHAIQVSFDPATGKLDAGIV